MPSTAPSRALQTALLAATLPLAPTGCNVEAIYDLIHDGESSAETERPDVWLVEGLVHNGVTLFVETRPGAVVKAAIERDDTGKTLLTVEGTADDKGLATLNVVPEQLELGAKPKEKIRYKARIQVEGDETRQMVHMGFSPAEITSVGIEAPNPGTETITLHIACKDRWLTHKPAEFTAVDGKYAVRLFVPEAKRILIAGEELPFAPEPRTFSGKNKDYESKDFERPVPTATLSLPPEAFSDAMVVGDLKRPKAEVGPRFEVTLADGTVCNGSLARSMPTGLDINAYLAKPGPVSLAGDDADYDGKLAALYHSHKSTKDKPDITALGKSWGPPTALRYIIKSEEDARYGKPCAYKNTTNGERVDINRVARDKLITVYDRRTGEVAKSIRIKARMPGCASETYGHANLENDASDEKVEKRVEAWAKKNLR